MKIFNKIILAAVALMAANSVYSQELQWSVDLKTSFDNREYGLNPVAKSQTIFGARLTPQVGVKWGNNALMMGSNAIIEFGGRPFDVNPDLLLYYAYNTKKHKAYAGAFPRTKMMGQFSTAFFSDSLKFYDNALEGMLLQYTAARGFIEFGVDWNGLISSTNREKFMIFSAGQMRRGLFYGGYDLTVLHHAGSEKVNGVVDNILVQPYVGLNLTERTSLDSLSIQVGYLQAMQNDRRYVGMYTRPGGPVIDITIAKWGVGVHNTIYLGDGIMPYYKYYGAGLYSGDTFFRANHGIYNRLEVYWQLIQRNGINLRIASIHHYEGNLWGWQQLLSFNVAINRGTFNKKKCRHNHHNL